MADEEKPKQTPTVGERFPNLKQLEEDVERAKLEKALAEARAATAVAKQPKPPELPEFDLEVAADTVTKSDYVTGLARVLVQMDAIAVADDIADAALIAARNAGNARKYRFRVAHDCSLLAAVDRYRLLKGQLAHLQTRLNEAAPARADEQEKKQGEEAFRTSKVHCPWGVGRRNPGCDTGDWCAQQAVRPRLSGQRARGVAGESGPRPRHRPLPGFEEEGGRDGHGRDRPSPAHAALSSDRNSGLGARGCK